jgi:hypothetical protein
MREAEGRVSALFSWGAAAATRESFEGRVEMLDEAEWRRINIASTADIPADCDVAERRIVSEGRSSGAATSGRVGAASLSRTLPVDDKERVPGNVKAGVD